MRNDKFRPEYVLVSLLCQQFCADNFIPLIYRWPKAARLGNRTCPTDLTPQPGPTPVKKFTLAHYIWCAGTVESRNYTIVFCTPSFHNFQTARPGVVLSVYMSTTMYFKVCFLYDVFRLTRSLTVSLLVVNVCLNDMLMPLCSIFRHLTVIT